MFPASLFSGPSCRSRSVPQLVSRRTRTRGRTSSRAPLPGTADYRLVPRRRDGLVGTAVSRLRATTRGPERPAASATTPTPRPAASPRSPTSAPMSARSSARRARWISAPASKKQRGCSGNLCPKTGQLHYSSQECRRLSTMPRKCGAPGVSSEALSSTTVAILTADIASYRSSTALPSKA